MPRDSSLTRRLVVILCVWLCVWGLSAMDLWDLTDELLESALFDQVLTPEAGDKGSGATAASVAAALEDFTVVHPDPVTVLHGTTAPSLRPRYQQLVQYRL